MIQLLTCLAIYAFIFLCFLPISLKEDKVQLLDRTHTSVLKGIAILAVLFGHIGQYASVDGIEFPAGVGVSLFILLSGYGLAKSNFKNPVKVDFWKRRVLKLYIPYLLIRGGVLSN